MHNLCFSVQVSDTYWQKKVYMRLQRTKQTHTHISHSCVTLVMHISLTAVKTISANLNIWLRRGGGGHIYWGHMIAHPLKSLPPGNTAARLMVPRWKDSSLPSLFTSWLSSHPQANISLYQHCCSIVGIVTALQKRFQQAEIVHQCHHQRAQIYRWHVDRKRKVKNRSSNMLTLTYVQIYYICKFSVGGCFFVISLNRHVAEEDSADVSYVNTSFCQDSALLLICIYNILSHVIRQRLRYFTE